MEKYIFDLVVFVLLAAVVAVSAKRGFAKTVLDSVSVAVGFFTAYKFASVFSEFIYNKIIGIFVEKSFLKVVENIEAGLSAEEKISALIKTLPQGLLDFSKNIGVDTDSLVNNVLNADISTDELLVKAVSEKLVYGIANFIIEFIVFVLIFAIVSVTLKLVSTVFSKTIEKIPIVGTANYILGGVLGAVKAVFILFVVCSVGYLVMIAMNTEPNQYISDSFTYQYIMKNNPIIILVQG